MRLTRLVAPIVFLGLGCGGGGSDPEPLIATTLTGEYEGRTFVPTNGFAIVSEERPLIAVGDGNLHCGSAASNAPPSGTNAGFGLDAFEVGTYGSVLVQIYSNVDGFESHGSNSGTVTLTAVSAASISGTIDFSYTSDESETYAIAGSFEVARCPE